MVYDVLNVDACLSLGHRLLLYFNRLRNVAVLIHHCFSHGNMAAEIVLCLIHKRLISPIQKSWVVSSDLHRLGVLVFVDLLLDVLALFGDHFLNCVLCGLCCNLFV